MVTFSTLNENMRFRSEFPLILRNTKQISTCIDLLRTVSSRRFYFINISYLYKRNKEKVPYTTKTLKQNLINIKINNTQQLSAVNIFYVYEAQVRRTKQKKVQNLFGMKYACSCWMMEIGNKIQRAHVTISIRFFFDFPSINTHSHTEEHKWKLERNGGEKISYMSFLIQFKRETVTSGENSIGI